MSNLNYEAGCNPVNTTYVTGLGWQRQRVIVHQNALNYRECLPPSGTCLMSNSRRSPFAKNAIGIFSRRLSS